MFFLQVYLLVPQTNIEEDVDTELEIDEVNAFEAEQPVEDEQKSTFSKLLLSKVIHRESESSERYDCPIWTQGLERTFKVRILSPQLSKALFERVSFGTKRKHE